VIVTKYISYTIMKKNHYHSSLESKIHSPPGQGYHADKKVEHLSYPLQRESLENQPLQTAKKTI
jgi:hypothetical protein